MPLTRRILAIIAFFCVVSLPLLANRRPDTGNSSNGTFSNCGNGGTCAALSDQGTATFTGTDQSGNAVTVTITLYNWGFYPCGRTTCNPNMNRSIIDVILAGTDNVGIQSVIVKGSLINPSYVSCAGENTQEGISCMNSPEPDSTNVQEPTPIAGADTGTFVNTRWDFGGVPASNPPLPAIPFYQLLCLGADGGPDSICNQTPGEAILTASGTVAKNKLTTSAGNYLITLTDGTQLGSLTIPASPTKQAANNTQATATVISATSFSDYIDTSQTNPGIDVQGNMTFPSGFALAPLPPQSSLSTFPSCDPFNEATGTADPRTFRSVWYTYTPTSTGWISLNTAGSRYDTLVYVFTGSAAAPTTVACDDDAPAGLMQGGVTFQATAGTQYWIVVYETPTSQTTDPGTLTGYPLSVDGALHFSSKFTTTAPTTTTKLTSYPITSKFDESVALTATVTSKSPGQPGGTVTFSQGGTILGTRNLIGTQATMNIASLALGTDALTASYSGDSVYPSSTGKLSITVQKAATTLKLSSNVNPVVVGQPITFTAVITPKFGGQSSGTITFKDGATSLGAVAVANNSASLTISTLAVGSHSITASYGGDSDFTGSTSKALTEKVIN